MPLDRADPRSGVGSEPQNDLNGNSLRLRANG